MRSVSNQRYPIVEHLLKDANSIDQTREIAVANNPNVRFVAKRDSGIYDAMNQGYALCTGEIIAYLNSDDWYADDMVLADVAAAFSNQTVDYVYGDLEMVNRSGDVVRKWVTTDACLKRLHSHHMPHPALFIHRRMLDQLPNAFDTSYRLAADLKQQLQVVNLLQGRGLYIPRTLTIMEVGGASTNGWRAFIQGWAESRRAYNEVEGSGGLWYAFRKVLHKFSGLRFGAIRHLYSGKH